MRTGSIRACGLALAVATFAAMLAPGPSRAADRLAGGALQSAQGAVRSVQLGVGKSFVIELPRDASEVLVADPKIANAVVRSARKAYLIGVAIGETDVIFFDAQGEQILALAVSVGRDLGPIRGNLRVSMPSANVAVQPLGDSVTLTGSVRSAGDAQTAVDIASKLVGDPKKVVNALAIEGREQVLLKVTVTEMQRSVIKQLGINWNAQGTFGTTLLGFGSNPTFPINDSTPGSVLTPVSGTGNVNQNTNGNGVGIFSQGPGGRVLGNLEALEEHGLIRTLAEPTLTAISGEKADFLAGGEFPVPVGSDEEGIKIEFKKYGVALGFTPVVLSEGRISLQVSTEVSELTQEGSLIVTTGRGTGSSNLAIPGLRVRRANTTVELPSGGSLAMAGLLRDDVRQAYNGLPGLMNLPVLGALFRSRDFQRNQTELVVLVSPYVAKPVSRNQLARPDDGFETPSDTSAILLGRLNRIYAVPGARSLPRYQGPVGYILD